MLVNILFILIGIMGLFFGADWLVRGSSSLALRLGLTPLVVGLTVVAFGTSSPELIVSLRAAFGGSGDIAVGNVVGSNIINIGVILAVAVLLRPIAIQRQILRFDAPVMVICSFVLVLMLADARLVRWEGGLLAAGLFLYIGFNLWEARREHLAGIPEPHLNDERPDRSVLLDVVLMIAGLGALGLGANLLVRGASEIARTFGWSEAFIGLTIVAVGTSLPELATSLVAGFRREADIAVGNVIGSNVFNILGILGISSLVIPLEAGGIGRVDLFVMLAASMVVPALMFSARTLVRWEGGLLLTGYLGYLVYLIYLLP